MSSPDDRAHRRRRMSGRDPHEEHRSATPLELLYDLTFVVAFGIAADELAHFLADGHFRSGVFGFCFATFAVAWAWINYSWFASAYDTDDWVMRLATMVQMLGVIVLALGLEQAFASIEEGDVLDNGVMVAGYVVMRVPMIFLWLRAARHDPPRRPAALAYVWTISVAQVFWVVLAIVDLPIVTTFAIAAVLIGIEMIGPVVARAAEGRDAVARAPHRRAVRAARDHHARRGDHRHGRLDQRGRARLRGLDGRRGGRRLRRRRAHLRDVVDVLRDPVGGGAAAAPRAVVHVGLRPHRRLRRAGGDRRGPARRRLLPRARDDARPDGHRAEHGDPGRRSTSPRCTASTPRSPATSTRSTSRCWRGRPA